MPASTEQPDGGLLSGTLQLALAQCQDQARRFAEQSQMVDELKRENEQLKRELEALKIKPPNEIESKYSKQFQQVFQQVAAKQVEVDRLKDKLRRAKVKAQRHGLSNLITSSPADTSNGVQSASPRTPNSMLPPLPKVNKKDNVENTSDKRVVRSTQSASPPRKRPRSLGTAVQPLQEVSVNLESETPKSGRMESKKSTGRLTVSDSIIAIPQLAEDGDDHVRRNHKSEGEQKLKVMPESVYHRLDNLLDSDGSSRPVLLRTQSSSPPSTNHPRPSTKKARFMVPASDLPSPSAEDQPDRPRSSLATSRRRNLDPEDDEPFRSRPIHRLNLQHFKINPANNSGLDYAFNQVVRGHNRKCLPGCTKECCVGTFRALADTLPGLSSSNGRHISDHQLLLDYLGPGSEERIRTLTPKARENLIHDARTRLMANTYGKMHRDVHERGRSPPGFWRVDMPGSQEHNEDREQAKLSEREQVLQRYNDAMKGGGRWMFADE